MKNEERITLSEAEHKHLYEVRMKAPDAVLLYPVVLEYKELDPDAVL